MLTNSRPTLGPPRPNSVDIWSCLVECPQMSAKFGQVLQTTVNVGLHLTHIGPTSTEFGRKLQTSVQTRPNVDRLGSFWSRCWSTFGQFGVKFWKVSSNVGRLGAHSGQSWASLSPEAKDSIVVLPLLVGITEVRTYLPRTGGAQLCGRGSPGPAPSGRMPWQVHAHAIGPTCRKPVLSDRRGRRRVGAGIRRRGQNARAHGGAQGRGGGPGGRWKWNRGRANGAKRPAN